MKLFKKNKWLNKSKRAKTTKIEISIVRVLKNQKITIMKFRRNKAWNIVIKKRKINKI